MEIKKPIVVIFTGDEIRNILAREAILKARITEDFKFDVSIKFDHRQYRNSDGEAVEITLIDRI